MLALTIAARVASHHDRAAAAAHEAQVRMLTLRAASQVRAVRITPNPRSWSATPDATVAWPDPPELLELYLPVAYSDYRVFADHHRQGGRRPRAWTCSAYPPIRTANCG